MQFALPLCDLSLAISSVLARRCRRGKGPLLDLRIYCPFIPVQKQAVGKQPLQIRRSRF